MKFQSSTTASIHRLHYELCRLLKRVLSFFVKPAEIAANSADLTKVEFSAESNQPDDDEVFIGDDAAADLLHLEDNEVEDVCSKFYDHVVLFYMYMAFIKKILKAFDLKSSPLLLLKMIDPSRA